MTNISVPDDLVPLVEAIVKMAKANGLEVHGTKYRIIAPSNKECLCNLQYKHNNSWFGCYACEPGSEENPTADNLFEDIYREAKESEDKDGQL